MNMKNKPTIVFENEQIQVYLGEGYWLWDKTRKMNLSMRAETERDAYTEALRYYSRRLKYMEEALQKYRKCVSDIIGAFDEDGDPK